MEKHNIKTNLPALAKTIKKTGVALFTGACVLTTPLAYTSVHAATSYTTSTVNNLMDYFLETQNSNVERYLDKEETKTNLIRLLGYYDTLYDYINGNKTVQSTKFNYLNSYEQETLENLLTDWSNQIYERYSRESYFKTTCQDELGFTLRYRNDSTGYDYNHNRTMEYYEETAREKFDNYMSKSKSQSNLTNALKIYDEYLDFIKGSVRTLGYVFNELTVTEQNAIFRLVQDLTSEIMEYEGYSYYETSCIRAIGWAVNIENFNREMSKYYNNYSYNPNYNNYYNPNTGYIPEYVPNDNYYPNNGYITNGEYKVPQSTPQAVQITPSGTPNGGYNQYPNTNGNINTTVGKDWRADYIDPSIDTSYGDSYGNYVPEYVGDNYINNNYYNNDYYNGYNSYYDDYEAPEYVYTR